MRFTNFQFLLLKLPLIIDPSTDNRNHQNILFLLLDENPCKMFNFLKPFCSDEHVHVAFLVRV